MQNFTANFEVYSPRWGHTDRYNVAMSQKELKVTQGTFSATCRLAANGDPVWSGHNASTGNPVMNIFSNDSIYAPDIVPLALEWAWQKWRESAVDESVLRDGLKELFAWVDATARGKPSGALWQGAF